MKLVKKSFRPAVDGRQLARNMLCDAISFYSYQQLKKPAVSTAGLRLLENRYNMPQ